MGKKKTTRLGRAAFFLPIVAVVAVILYAVLAGLVTPDGSLVIRAVSSDRYYTPIEISTQATVGSTTSVTPFNLTLTAGYYEVTYAPVTGFHTPSPRSAAVVRAGTTYAIGVFDPIVKVVSLTSSGFNATSLTALHGITPVVWVNSLSTEVALEIQPVGRVLLPPNGNFTYVFTLPGQYPFATVSGGLTGTVQVG